MTEGSFDAGILLRIHRNCLGFNPFVFKGTATPLAGKKLPIPATLYEVNILDRSPAGNHRYEALFLLIYYILLCDSDTPSKRILPAVPVLEDICCTPDTVHFMPPQLHIERWRVGRGLSHVFLSDRVH